MANTVDDLVAKARIIADDGDSLNPGLSAANWRLLVVDAIRKFAPNIDRIDVVKDLFTAASGWVNSTQPLASGVVALFAQASGESAEVYSPSTARPVLKQMSYAEFNVSVGVAASAGMPTQFCLRRDPVTTVGLQARFNPTGSGTNYKVTGWVLKHPDVDDIDDGTSDITFLRPMEQYTIARMAAIEGMRLLGREPWERQAAGALVSQSIETTTKANKNAQSGGGPQ
jgi:hypothetical protein